MQHLWEQSDQKTVLAIIFSMSDLAIIETDWRPNYSIITYIACSAITHTDCSAIAYIALACNKLGCYTNV